MLQPVGYSERMKRAILLAVLALASCEAPPPPRLATPSVVPSASPSAAADTDSADAAPPRAEVDAGTPLDPSVCAGAAVDLRKALENAACYVDGPAAGEPPFPPSVKVSLASGPAKMQDWQHGRATLALRNDSAADATLYFLPRGNAVKFELHLVDPRTRHVHRVASEPFLSFGSGPGRRARIVLAPGGVATYGFCWVAERTMGRPVRLSPANQTPLDPGPYQLVLWTALAGFASKDVEGEHRPWTNVDIVAGLSCRSSGTDPACQCSER